MSTLLSPVIFLMQHPVTVIVCVILQMIIGMVWYGPLFGTTWAKLHGISRDPKNATFSSMKGAFIINILSNIVQAMVLGRVLTLTRFSGILAPLLVVAILWLAFQFTVIVTGYAYMKKPMKLVWIESLYTLVSWEVMALVIVLL